MNTWRELRERRLIQVILGYLVIAWGTLELLNLLVERGVLADWMWTVAFILALFGIPASIIIGWYHGEKGAQRVSGTEFALLSVVALAGLGTAGWVATGSWVEDAAGEASGDLRDVAVLYFEPGDTSLLAVADGLTEALVGQLRGVQGLNVLSTNAVRPYRAESVPVESIGRTLAVGTVIEGTVERRRDGRVAVTTALREAAAGGLIARSTIALPEGQVLALIDSVTTDIARVLRTNLGQEVRVRRDRASTENPQAWLLLQQGRAAWKEAEDLDGHDPDAVSRAIQRADSLFVQAAHADTAWMRPDLERAQLAYFASRSAHDLASIERAIDESLTYVDRVLERDPSHAEALAVRGTTRYWRQLLPIDPDLRVRRRLREDARADLERAVAQDPGLARAYSTLSHLYYVEESRMDAVMAAQSALEADAYLSDAPDVMWRLFWPSYDLEMFPTAERWCLEGARRFPDDSRFVLCQLVLMTSPHDPDPDEAWRLAERLDSLLPDGEPSASHHYARLVVGGVLGRAGLADSARAVLERSRAPAEIDPERELLAVEAFMWTLVGDDDRAVRLLQQYVAANPDHRFQQGGEVSWWWRGLEGHPGFQRLRRP